MTDTERARLGLDVVFSQPALTLPLAEACDVWRKAGYVVKNSAVSMDGRTRSSCRIWPASYPGVPHAWEDCYVYEEGPDARAVITAALRKAAAKWPGVV